MTDADVVREYVLDAHRETLAAVLRCADAVAPDRDRAAGATDEQTPVTDGRTLAVSLEAKLREEGVLGEFPTLLAGGATAASSELPATPVAAPPYVAVTSVGPIARATFPDRRLVIAVEVFAVERGESSRSERARYVRRARSPAEALSVRFRR